MPTKTFQILALMGTEFKASNDEREPTAEECMVVFEEQMKKLGLKVIMQKAVIAEEVPDGS